MSPGRHFLALAALAAGAGMGFPGAPRTQPNGYGVSSGACPPAAPNRYLPPHSGCVTVRRADVNGDGRPDLIIVYSRLSPQRLAGAPGAPPRSRHEFGAVAAYLEVVLSTGTSVTTQIRGVYGARAAALDAVSHVGAEPGDEVFLEVRRISSGAQVVAYGFHDGELIPAGVLLSYGGDSGAQAGFDCIAGHPPRVVQHHFTFVGPSELTRSWRETTVVYAWHGPRLVRVSRQTLKPLVALKSGETRIGAGCLHGVR